MNLNTLALVALIVVIFIGLPAFLFWSMVDHAKNAHRRERRGGGGSVLMELDRLVARPSVEHIVEAENKIAAREDDQGGE